MTFSFKSFAARLVRLPWPTKKHTRRRSNAKERILYVANGLIPTLQICFINPLSELSESGEIEYETLTDQRLSSQFGKNINSAAAAAWIDGLLVEFEPSIIIFCRYSGPCAKQIMSYASLNEVATIYHLDDDLLNVPIELGQAKYDFHNHPDRLEAVSYLLRHSNIIYCSTAPLKDRLIASGIDSDRYFVGPLHCTNKVLARALPGPVLKIGYMGFDHEHDLKQVLPALIKVLEKYPDIKFELFGKIPKPKELDSFGSRVRVIPVEVKYQDFMRKMTDLGWQIGICPLADTKFNKTKSDNKWVEYSAVGAAVIASEGSVYDECCSGGCGLLARTADEWESSFALLIEDSDFRQSLVRRAQNKLLADYSPAAVKDQIFHVIRLANDQMLRQQRAGK